MIKKAVADATVLFFFHIGKTGQKENSFQICGIMVEYLV